MRTFLSLIILLGSTLFAFSQKTNSGFEAFNQKIEIGLIQYEVDFDSLTARELEFLAHFKREEEESIKKTADSIKSKYGEEIKKWYDNIGFSNNRSRVFFEYNDSDKREMSLPCECHIENDTLTIVSGIGFFGGVGIGARTYKGKFSSFYYEYTDQPYFKEKKTDDSFARSITVGAKNQRLLVENMPRKNQLLNGHLQFVTNPFYSDPKADPLLEVSIGIEMYFRCYVIEITEEE